MSFHSVTALLAVIVAISTSHAADSEPPTCESLGIPEDTECMDYCGDIGYDGTTTISGDVGSPGSSFWSHDALGQGCKCKISPPGTEYNHNMYEIICQEENNATINKTSSSSEMTETKDGVESESKCDKLNTGCITSGSTRISIAAGMAAVAFAAMPIV